LAVGMLPKLAQDWSERPEVDERARQQAEVARLGVRALSGCSIEELIKEAIGALRTHLRVPIAILTEFDGDFVHVVAADGFAPPAPRRVPPGSIGAQLRRTGTAIISADVSLDHRFKVA